MPTLPAEDGEYVPNCSEITWNELSSETFSQNISLLAVNIRSFAGKFSEFVAHINLLKFKFTVLIITETWLNENTDIAFDINGYNCFSIYRNGQIGGGIKIYIEESLSASVIEEISSVEGAYEGLFVKMFVPDLGDVTVGGVYRPPGKSVVSFCEQITDTIHYINDSGCIVLGDFNLNTLDQSNTSVQNYLNIFCQYN